jgi:hypothetical protein
LHAIISDYFKRHVMEIIPALEIDNDAMTISPVASTRGVALLLRPRRISYHGLLSLVPQGRNFDHRCGGRILQRRYSNSITLVLFDHPSRFRQVALEVL